MIDGIADELLEDLGAHNKEFIQEIVNQESRATPIDTGLSSSNWFVSKSPLDRTYRYTGVGNAGPLKAQQRAQSTLDRFTKKLSTIYVQNNVDYLDELNMGKSKQAPAGFIDIALMNALNRYYPR
jgi:hypothetical protein